MSKKDKLSIFISLILRHKPEVIGITLDQHGWADVEALIDGINNSGHSITFDQLKKIVAEDAKGRYSFNSDDTFIRANQGHSMLVDVELIELKPPEILFHGTATRFLDNIRTEGIRPMSRQYVHLSEDIDTAINVGKRHGKPVALLVKSMAMYKDGYQFFRSDNGVWLTKKVPCFRYIKDHML